MEIHNDFEQLITDYQPLVHAIAGRLVRDMPATMDVEDLVQYGEIGLLEAARRYKPERRVAFSNYAFTRVRGAMMDGARRFLGFRRSRSRDLLVHSRAVAYLERKRQAGQADGMPDGWVGLDTIPFDHENETHFSARSEETGFECYRELNLLRLRDAMRRLAPQEHRFITLYYGNDKTLQEIGAELGLSRSGTCRLHRRTLHKLHSLMTVWTQ